MCRWTKKRQDNSAVLYPVDDEQRLKTLAEAVEKLKEDEKLHKVGPQDTRVTNYCLEPKQKSRRVM